MDISKIIASVIIAAAVFGLGLLGLQRVDTIVDQYKRMADNDAIHQCAQDYRTDSLNPTTNATTSRPMEQQVRECAWQKGVKNYTGVWSDLLK